MEELRSPLMEPAQPEPTPPQGGLASRAIGGLASFMTNVNKGIETVLTNPLYARAWSGMVSYAANDPMAGPAALENLHQMRTQNELSQRQLEASKIPTAQDTLAQLRLQDYRIRQNKLAALDRALADSDPTNDRAAYAAAYPDEAAKAHFAVQKPGAVKTVTVYDPKGTGSSRQMILTHDAQGNPVTQEIPGSGWKPPSQGVVVGIDANGNPIVTVGGQGAAALTNPTKTDIEKRQLSAEEGIARLDEISRAFEPTFQTLGTKFDMARIMLSAKLGQPVSPDDQARLERFVTFRAQAYNQMNGLLHELSGAAISPAEMERLVQSMPNPGSGMFDGDDYITFQAKLNAVQADLRAALMRNQKRRQGGMGTASTGPETPPPMPEGVPQGSAWDPHYRAWRTPDGRYLVEE